jgi:hypothetical protein
VTVKDDDLCKRVANLIKATQDYATFLCYIASNAATLLTNWCEYLDLATNNENNKELSNSALNSAIDNQNHLEEIKTEFTKDIQSKKEVLYDCQIKYLSKLNLMFGSDFHLKG